MKGCPLRCKWCHSPEGQSLQVERITRKDRSQIVIGKEWTSEKLARYMDKMRDVFDGGFTFTGGDPLMQADFLLETFSKLKCKHDIIIETSGYGDMKKLVQLAMHCSKIHFGMKNLDVSTSKKCVGITSFDQKAIIQTFDKQSTTRYDLVIPRIKDVTDTKDYALALNDLVLSLKRLDKVQNIPYNEMTEAKRESFYNN